MPVAWGRWRASLVAIGLAASFAGGISAQPAPARPEVDVALVLAVDISYSMDMEELALQREGYINALTSKPVLDAIRNGMIGKIAVTYLEWAGTLSRHVIVDWRIIDGPASAREFVEELRAAPIRRARRTSISGAIDFATDRLEAAPFRPLRQVIDVSGDGPNNEGRPVTVARARALAGGITINGLPIVLKRNYVSPYDISGLDAYYEDCVIGGPGAFLVTITAREQFSEAIKVKILREVAQAGTNDAGPPGGGRGADCQIGERLWRENWERN